MKIALIWPNITTLAVDSKYYNVQAYGLAPELTKLGHEVVIMTSNLFMGKTRKTKKNSKVSVQDHDNYKIVYMPGYASQRYPLMPNLLKELVKFKPDVVQSVEDISPATLISLMYSKLKGVPLFVYQGVYEHAVFSPFISKAARSTIFLPIYKFSSGFLTKSRDAADFLIQCGVKPEKTHVVNVGFKDSQFKNVRTSFLNEITGLTKDRKILVSVGLLIARKNHAIVIDAIEKIIGIYPEAALAIFGDGPEKEFLLKRINEKKLQNFVKIITEKISNNEMHKIYSSSFACLVPSIHEIFGMIVLEAMACSRPVIGSNLGGMKDVIKNGENGFKVNPYDVDGIVSKIKRIIKDTDLYEKMCKNALETSLEYSWKNISKKFERHYIEAMR